MKTEETLGALQVLGNLLEKQYPYVNVDPLNGAVKGNPVPRPIIDGDNRKAIVKLIVGLAKSIDPTLINEEMYISGIDPVEGDISKSATSSEAFSVIR